MEQGETGLQSVPLQLDHATAAPVLKLEALESIRPLEDGQRLTIEALDGSEPPVEARLDEESRLGAAADTLNSLNSSTQSQRRGEAEGDTPLSPKRSKQASKELSASKVPRQRAKHQGSASSRKASRQSLSDASQKKESSPQENGLIKWLRSSTPKEKALPSEDEAKSSLKRSNQNARQNRQAKKKESVKDDASRIRNRVKYLINKMNREQTLIDAYAGDGWNRQSLEKLRPEQELRRAEMQILQCKLGIRQAFEELHTLSLQGSIQDSAFDGEGQIYHDDIFCAKCKSKEYFPDNDIILCDGACNRAFHQYCLEPPLKTEDIPPGEEGWFCPVCDCKFECLDAINDHLGTDFQLEDSWEKIFADAVVDGNDEGNPLDAREDWPSEDSTDDDYDPEGENPDKAEKQFENDSPAEGSDLDGDSSDSSDDSSEVVFFDEFGKTSKVSKTFEEESDSEESSPEPGEDMVLVSGKRQRSDVDYKQLYDEVYGANASDYDSSEDEDYGKKKSSKKSKVSDGEIMGSAEAAVPKDKDRGNDQEIPDALSQGRKSSTRLPKELVMKLQEVFKDCQLPSKVCKVDLSKQLGLTLDEVNVWFRNARRAAVRRNNAKERTDPDSKEGASEGLSAPSGSLVAKKIVSIDTSVQGCEGQIGGGAG